MKIEPQIFFSMPEFTVASVEYTRWPEFKQPDSLHLSAWCFGLFAPNGKLIAFNSVLPPVVSGATAWGHRLVVLPGWRGKGIALAFDEWLGEQLLARGIRYCTLCLHPGLTAKFEKSENWEKCGSGDKRIYRFGNGPTLPRTE